MKTNPRIIKDCLIPLSFIIIRIAAMQGINKITNVEPTIDCIGVKVKCWNNAAAPRSRRITPNNQYADDSMGRPKK